VLLLLLFQLIVGVAVIDAVDVIVVNVPFNADFEVAVVDDVNALDAFVVAVGFNDVFAVVVAVAVAVAFAVAVPTVVVVVVEKF